jgi:hypothetical protein
LEQPRELKEDRFGTENVNSRCRLGLMKTVAELAKFKLVFMEYRKSDGIIFVPIQQLITMKIQFYYPGFYTFFVNLHILLSSWPNAHNGIVNL